MVDSKQRIIKHLFLAFALVAGAASARAQDASNPALNWYANYQNNSFVIAMPLNENNAVALGQRLKALHFYQIYIPTYSLKGQAEIQLGFFSDGNKAEQLIKVNQRYFTGMRAQKISATQHQQIIDRRTDSALLINGDNTETAASIEVMFEQAKQYYLEKKYHQAAQFYQLLSVIGPADKSAWALELLALCQTRSGDWQQAKLNYESWLGRFPEHQARPRIEQRLRSLESAASLGQTPLRRAQNNADNNIYGRGVIGQYYRVVNRQVGDSADEQTLGLLSTDWDLRGGGQWLAHDARVRINGYWLHDQLETDASRVQLRRAYLDYEHSDTGIGVILGRQKDSESGVFTSFDGVTLNYALNQNWRFAASTGSPVYYSDTLNALDQSFYSFQAAWDSGENWYAKSYWVNQTVNGMTDREAVGLQGGYLGSSISSSILIDYDTAFGEINSIMWNGYWAITTDSSLSAVYGQQRSPMLTASNILIGQADLDLDTYLRNQENQNNLLDDALLRTAMNDYFTITGQTQLGDNVRFSVDYYNSTLSDIPNYEELAGLPNSGTQLKQFSYQSVGAQVQFDRLISAYDFTSLGARRIQSSTSDTNQVFANIRLSVGSTLFIGPKISLSQVSFSERKQLQTQLRYSLALNYRPWRNFEVNLEAGNESIDQDLGGPSFNTNYYFIGYRWNF